MSLSWLSIPLFIKEMLMVPLGTVLGPVFEQIKALYLPLFTLIASTVNCITMPPKTQYITLISFLNSRDRYLQFPANNVTLGFLQIPQNHNSKLIWWPNNSISRYMLSRNAYTFTKKHVLGVSSGLQLYASLRDFPGIQSKVSHP